MASPSGRSGRPRLWTRALAIEVGLILAIPVGLGATVGFFEINPVAAELFTPVGFEAHLLLDAFPDDRLIVEIAYDRSVGPPTAASVSTLLDRIKETCDKSSVVVDVHAITSPSSNYSDAGLLSLEEQVRQHWPVPGTMALFYLYLGASYGPESDVIGLAYRGSSIAIFEGTITSDTSLLGNAAAVTTTVMVHEFGHELGLVGIIGNAPNEDHAHPPHSTDPNDVMYWEVDTTGIALLGSNPPTQFDNADIADLATVRSTPIPTELLPWGVLITCLLAAGLLVRHDVRVRRGKPAQGTGREQAA
jgi:hypothetical protein